MLKLPIVHLRFPNQYLMNASLLRFQEYHESPKFRHKVFNLEEFMDWYASEKGGTFTYFEDWVGCNFPGHILTLFEESYSLKEALVREAVEGALDQTSRDLPFYIIGTAKGIKVEALAHEIVHGLYFTHSEYASKVNKLCREHSAALAPFLKTFKWMGYHKEVYRDECNAYMTTGLPPKCSVPARQLPMKEFRDLFRNYFGFDVKKLDSPAWQAANLHTVHMKTPRTYGRKSKSL